MATEATPRINAQYLESFTNRTVRILGKVVALNGDTATVDAGGEVVVWLGRVRFAFFLGVIVLFYFALFLVFGFLDFLFGGRGGGGLGV